MNLSKEIRALAKANKGNLYGFFYEGKYRLNNDLKSLKPHQLNTLNLLSIESPFELCRLVKTPFYILEKLINEPVYKHYSIEKKKGGFREICAPAKRLKKTQRSLNYFLQAYYLWIKPNAVHGFVINPGYLNVYCNIAENARVHVGKKHVLNIDLKDFFPSISARRVKALFQSECFGFDEQMATALTLLATFEGKLPIGAPSSPVISNFICLQLDKELIEFCAANDLSFSRYADDLTFSSDSVIIQDEILDIINIIQKNNFKINGKKLYLRASNQRQVVTGLTVNEKVNIDRKLLKQIRAMIHDLHVNGLEVAAQKHFNIPFESSEAAQLKFFDRLSGYINFVGQIRGKEDLLFQKLTNNLIEAVRANSRKLQR